MPRVRPVRNTPRGRVARLCSASDLRGRPLAIADLLHLFRRKRRSRERYYLASTELFQRNLTLREFLIYKAEFVMLHENLDAELGFDLLLKRCEFGRIYLAIAVLVGIHSSNGQVTTRIPGEAGTIVAAGFACTTLECLASPKAASSRGAVTELS